MFRRTEPRLSRLARRVEALRDRFRRGRTLSSSRAWGVRRERRATASPRRSSTIRQWVSIGFWYLRRRFGSESSSLLWQGDYLKQRSSKKRECAAGPQSWGARGGGRASERSSEMPAGHPWTTRMFPLCWLSLASAWLKITKAFISITERDASCCLPRIGLRMAERGLNCTWSTDRAPGV